MYLLEFIGEIDDQYLLTEQLPGMEQPEEGEVDSFEPLKRYHLYIKLKDLRSTLISFSVNNSDQQNDVNDLVYFLDLLIDNYLNISYAQIIELLLNFFAAAENVIGLKPPKEIKDELEAEKKVQDQKQKSDDSKEN